MDHSARLQQREDRLELLAARRLHEHVVTRAEQRGDRRPRPLPSSRTSAHPRCPASRAASASGRHTSPEQTRMSQQSRRDGTGLAVLGFFELAEFGHAARGGRCVGPGSAREHPQRTRERGGAGVVAVVDDRRADQAPWRFARGRRSPPGDTADAAPRRFMPSASAAPIAVERRRAPCARREAANSPRSVVSPYVTSKRRARRGRGP